MYKFILTLFTFLLLSFSSLSASELDFKDNDDLQRMSDLLSSFITTSIDKNEFSSSRYPKLDIQNKADAYIYHFDLAGVEKKDIKLSINNQDMLIIEGKKESKNKTTEDGYTKQEIFYGSFKRAVSIPENADQNKLTTKYDNGILTVSLPKKDLKKTTSKLIPIN